MAAEPNNYLGRWRLVPELCLYESGDPPRSGLYVIEADSEAVHISISWETDEGTHHVEFSGPTDGTKVPAQAPGVTHLSLTHVDSVTLDSSAYADNREIAYARRCASQSGDLLATVQEVSRDDGSTFRNFQVYRRDTSSTP